MVDIIINHIQEHLLLRAIADAGAYATVERPVSYEIITTQIESRANVLAMVLAHPIQLCSDRHK